MSGTLSQNWHTAPSALAAKTVHSTASLLFTCLGDAARLEHIPTNPMTGRKVKLPKRPKPNPAVMDASGLGAIFQAAQGALAVYSGPPVYLQFR
jgi:hypothetical protein